MLPTVFIVFSNSYQLLVPIILLGRNWPLPFIFDMNIERVGRQTYRIFDLNIHNLHKRKEINIINNLKFTTR